MKKFFLIFLALMLLSGCTADTIEHDMEKNTPTKYIEPTISVDDFSQLFIENEKIFNKVKNEMDKILVEAYTITLEGNALCFWNSEGIQISIKNPYDEILFVDLFNTMKNFCDSRIKNNCTIFIQKNNKGITFSIRDKDLSIDYCILFSFSQNTAKGPLHIVDSWYADKQCLV